MNWNCTETFLKYKIDRLLGLNASQPTLFDRIEAYKEFQSEIPVPPPRFI